jgi:hypothetical protein
MFDNEYEEIITIEVYNVCRHSYQHIFEQLKPGHVIVGLSIVRTN